MTQAQRLAPKAAEGILVRNPFNGTPLGEIAVSSAAEIGAAVVRAKAAQHEVRRSTPAVRRCFF